MSVTIGDELTAFLVAGHRDLRERKVLIQDEDRYERFYDKYLDYLNDIPTDDRIDAIYGSQRSKKHSESRRQIQRVLLKSGCKRQHLDFLTDMMHNFDFLYHYVTDEPQFPEKPTLTSRVKNVLQRVKVRRRK